MNVSLIVAHPNPQSFNHAIVECAAAQIKAFNHSVWFHDLYAEGFEPLLPPEEIAQDAKLAPEIGRHSSEIAAADAIVIVHPNWWGQPPAILKGWIDRVMRPGVAYRFLEGDSGEGVPLGLLRAKFAMVFNTSNTSPQRESEVFGDPLQTLWRNCVFGLCGVKRFYRRTFSVVVTSSAAQREQWLEEVRAEMGRWFGAR